MSDQDDDTAAILEYANKSHPPITPAIANTTITVRDPILTPLLTSAICCIASEKFNSHYEAFLNGICKFAKNLDNSSAAFYHTCKEYFSTGSACSCTPTNSAKNMYAHFIHVVFPNIDPQSTHQKIAAYVTILMQNEDSLTIYQIALRFIVFSITQPHISCSDLVLNAIHSADKACSSFAGPESVTVEKEAIKQFRCVLDYMSENNADNHRVQTFFHHRLVIPVSKAKQDGTNAVTAVKTVARDTRKIYASTLMSNPHASMGGKYENIKLNKAVRKAFEELVCVRKTLAALQNCGSAPICDGLKNLPAVRRSLNDILKMMNIPRDSASEHDDNDDEEEEEEKVENDKDKEKETDEDELKTLKRTCKRLQDELDESVKKYKKYKKMAKKSKASGTSEKEAIPKDELIKTRNALDKLQQDTIREKQEDAKEIKRLQQENTRLKDSLENFQSVISPHSTPPTEKNVQTVLTEKKTMCKHNVLEAKCLMSIMDGIGGLPTQLFPPEGHDCRNEEQYETSIAETVYSIIQTLFQSNGFFHPIALTASPSTKDELVGYMGNGTGFIDLSLVHNVYAYLFISYPNAKIDITSQFTAVLSGGDINNGEVSYIMIFNPANKIVQKYLQPHVSELTFDNPRMIDLFIFQTGHATPSTAMFASTYTTISLYNPFQFTPVIDTSCAATLGTDLYQTGLPYQQKILQHLRGTNFVTPSGISSPVKTLCHIIRCAYTNIMRWYLDRTLKEQRRMFSPGVPISKSSVVRSLYETSLDDPFFLQAVNQINDSVYLTSIQKNRILHKYDKLLQSGASVCKVCNMYVDICETDCMGEEKMEFYKAMHETQIRPFI